MKLEVGKIYTGLINNEPARYVGYDNKNDAGLWLHNFEYVGFHPVVIGYGQVEEEMLLEEYQLCEAFTVLYGS